MRIVSAAEVERALDYGALIARLREAFRIGCEAPLRSHHTIPRGNDPAATLLLMPAWRRGGPIGVKQVTVFPGNAERGLSAVMAAYLLLDGETGALVALIDGLALTVRRTACASALAADYLAREDAERLLMVGAGNLAPDLVRAHATVRPIVEVRIWNRHPERAARLAETLADDGIDATAVDDLEAAARWADIVSCATLTTAPLIRGEWLAPGAHLDLVGAFTPDMREADDEAVRRARIFVDTREGALNEAGDIVAPIARGVISEGDIQADLGELTRHEREGRGGADEITLFKSVGAALEDLAAAELVVESL